MKATSHLVSKLKKGRCSMLLDQMESGESFSTLLTLGKEVLNDQIKIGEKYSLSCSPSP